jgi:acetoacetyl-CoA synthetase
MEGDTIDDANKLLWNPSAEFISESNLQDFILWIEENYSYSFEDYDDLWDWSISASDEFWESILEYYRVLFNNDYEKIRTGSLMYKTKWFEGIKLSYAEHVFRNYTDDIPAIVYKTEEGKLHELSWQDLVSRVASLRQFMLNKGIVKGDRVVAYLPNIVEASISFLAVNSIGAIWSSTSPDFGFDSVVERFSQISPKLFIASDSYRYNGKKYDKTTEILNIAKEISSIENTVVVTSDNNKWIAENVSVWKDVLETEAEELVFERVEFSHPIWVLYSSGTTGSPKSITHSVGGILLEHLKYLGLHNNVKKGDRFFWYTTTGWMMWNYMHAAMLHGATIVLYDGSPSYPDLNTLWSLIDDAQINHFGIGASFITANMKSHTFPAKDFDLKTLISLGSTGSSLPPEAFDWIYCKVKNDVWLTSISGGTDVCSAFVGGNPMKPVYKGEIQCVALGCNLSIYNEEGVDIFDSVGEMVIKSAMPSMPIYFWGDNDFELYRKSYFDFYENVWRHGDWAKLTNNDGVIIYGRSDATLNRGGVRIGTSEIYRAIDSISEINDSMVLSLENDKGESRMPIFLSLKDEVELDNHLISKIKETIVKKYSPRHIPDSFYVVSDIPYTISGKKMETPFKKIFKGVRPEKAIKVGSMRNPDLLAEYIYLYKTEFEEQ